MKRLVGVLVLWTAITSILGLGLVSVTPVGAVITGSLSVSATSPAGTDTVDATWTTPTPTTDTSFNYSVRLLSGGTPVQTLATFPVTFASVPDGTYTVELTVSDGDSGPFVETSGNVTVAAAPPAGPPSAPSGVTATPAGSGVTISWGASTANGSDFSGSYLVTVSAGGGSQTVAGTSTSFAGLADGPYTVSVVAISTDQGNSAAASGAFTINTTGPPVAPTNVGASDSGSTVNVTWSQPAGSNPAVSTYTVTLSGAGAPGAKTVPAPATSTSFTGVPDGSYTVTVRANSPGGAGGGSTNATSTASVTVDAVQAPGTPPNVSANANDQTITVTWDAASANGSAVNGYSVTLNPANGSGAVTTDGAGRSATFTNMPAGNYTARVVATNDIGRSSAGTDTVTVVIPLTPPSGPPAGVRAIDEGSTVNVSWAAPDVTANNAAAFYVVTFNTGQTQTVNGTFASFGDVPPGDYEITVEARNSAGSGGAGQDTVSVTAAPSAPAVSAAADGRTVTVTWDLPGSDGNAAISDYVVRLSDGDEITVSSDANRIAVFEDRELGEFTATVNARNFRGEGDTGRSDVVITTRPFAPFETEEDFLRQQYSDFLGRNADESGLAYWGSLTEDDQANVDFVIEAFMASPEFAPRRSIARLYLAFFDRAPDKGGFDYWAEQINSGNADLDTISELFVQSPEFQETYGSLTDAEFIALVYNNVLLRTPDAGGYEYWLGQIELGLSRGELMTQFSESLEFVNSTRPAIDVIITYRGMLNRAPDSEGFQYWVGQVATDADSVRQLIRGFFTSPEYAARVTPE